MTGRGGRVRPPAGGNALWQVILAAFGGPEKPEPGREGCWAGDDPGGIALPPDLRSRRALRAFAAAVLQARKALEDNEALFRLRAAELDGDDLAAGQCLGQARAYKRAALLIGDAIGAATPRWDGTQDRRGRDETA